MLHTFEQNLPGDRDHKKETEPGSQFKEWVIGTAASGLDLVTDLMIRLYQAEADTASEYTLHSTVFSEVDLRPQNRRALALLQEWMSEPDDLGEEWWASFEQDLKQHRLSFREL